MKKLGLMLVITGMLVSAPAYGKAKFVAVTPGPGELESARTAEQRGDLARIRENYASAVSHYMTALRITNQNAVLYNKLGIAELQLGERRSARKHFVQALKFDPRYVAALNNLGTVAFLDKKYKPAIGYLKQALALDESSASAHLNLAEAWMGLGDIDHAMTEYARAIELDADILAKGQGGIQVQVSTPEQRARVSYLIAKAYARRGNIDGALEYLRRARDGRYPDLSKVYADQEFAALWPDPRLAKIVKP